MREGNRPKEKTTNHQVCAMYQTHTVPLCIHTRGGQKASHAARSELAEKEVSQRQPCRIMIRMLFSAQTLA